MAMKNYSDEKSERNGVGKITVLRADREDRLLAALSFQASLM